MVICRVCSMACSHPGTHHLGCLASGWLLNTQPCPQNCDWSNLALHTTPRIYDTNQLCQVRADCDRREENGRKETLLQYCRTSPAGRTAERLSWFLHLPLPADYLTRP
jgi:hypothetical protein